MKKILGTALLVTASIMSADTLNSINVGATQVTIGEETAQGLTAGYGVTKYADNGFMLGIDFNYDRADIEEISVQSLGSDIKLGYSYERTIGIYVIGSAIYQDTDSLKGYGLGGGVGIEYLPFENIGVAVDYKTYTVTTEVDSHSYDVAKAYLKVMF